jgi:hypothetical protein
MLLLAGQHLSFLFRIGLGYGSISFPIKTAPLLRFLLILR